MSVALKKLSLLLLTSWVGMQVLINFRISPLLPEVNKAYHCWNKSEKNIFSSKEVERGPSELLRGYCQHYRGPEQDLFSQEGARKPWTTWYFKLDFWRNFVGSDWVHIGRHFEWDFLHVSAPLSTLLAFIYLGGGSAWFLTNCLLNKTRHWLPNSMDPVSWDSPPIHEVLDWETWFFLQLSSTQKMIPP